MGEAKRRGTPAWRKDLAIQIRDAACDIVRMAPPEVAPDGTTDVDVLARFETDVDAPLICIVYGAAVEDVGLHHSDVFINPFRVERELRHRGFDEHHPGWEGACAATRDLCETSVRRLMSELRG